MNGALGIFLSLGFAGTDCWGDALPAAALPGQPAPVFCAVMQPGAPTAADGGNQWVDDFEHGLTFAEFDAADYQVFEAVTGVAQTRHWRHANHWMVDLAPRPPGATYGGDLGGTVIRPNAAFAFTDGRFVAETDFAAGHADYDGGQVWGEIVVTTAAQPTGFRNAGGAYGYDLFPGHYTLGCRLQSERVPICALMDDSPDGVGAGGRVWEMSFFQEVGEVSYGGYPQIQDRGDYWRRCAAENDSDILCRDRFRLSLTRNSVTLFVNGLKYFQQTAIPDLPDEMLQGDLYVYLASMIARPQYDVVRYHWDRIAVNPTSGPSFAPGFTADTLFRNSFE